MNMYIPAKFQVNPISFEGFMGGGMFCPPPVYYSSKKPGLDRVKQGHPILVVIAWPVVKAFPLCCVVLRWCYVALRWSL